MTEIIKKIEKQEQIFSKMAANEKLFSCEIVGREKQTEDLIRYLLSYKRGFVVPLVSVYGRSGSGKSTITKFVCENFDGALHCIVDLRKTKSVFGAANEILSCLGQPPTKSAFGLQAAMTSIGNSIEEKLQNDGRQLFVLVLDEVDAIFSDKRGSPSDFFYKLLTLGQEMKKHGKLFCIITISNNVLSDGSLDDRVRSRIGTSEIFFEPYSQKTVLEILRQISKKSFTEQIDKAVLERCAEQSAAEHGDARRAVELLRVSAETAFAKQEKITPAHVDLAVTKISSHKIKNYLSNMTDHQKYVCLALAKMTYIIRQPWHATSAIFKAYHGIIPEKPKALGYRRISEILVELEQAGILLSQAISKGRYGFGKNYKLTFSPEFVLQLFPEEAKEWKKLRDAFLDYKLNPYSQHRRKDIRFANEMGLLRIQGLL